MQSLVDCQKNKNKSYCNKIKEIKGFRFSSKMQTGILHIEEETKSSAHDDPHWMRCFSFFLKRQSQYCNYSSFIAIELNQSFPTQKMIPKGRGQGLQTGEELYCHDISLVSCANKKLIMKAHKILRQQNKNFISGGMNNL